MWTRSFVMLLLLVGVALAADETPPATGSIELPADAVKIDDLTWHHTDAEGTLWTYRQTPFGLVRFETNREEEATENASPAATSIQAFDEGDQVRFERNSPFGVSRWTRKKTELTELESEAWERAQKAKATSVNSKPEQSAPEE